LGCFVEVDDVVAVGVELAVLVAEELLVFGVDAAQAVLHAFAEAFEHHCDEHVENHHAHDHHEDEEEGQREHSAAALEGEVHAVQLGVTLFEAEVPCGHEVAVQGTQSLVLPAVVVLVHNQVVPGLPAIKSITERPMFLKLTFE